MQRRAPRGALRRPGSKRRSRRCSRARGRWARARPPPCSPPFAPRRIHPPWADPRWCGSRSSRSPTVPFRKPDPSPKPPRGPSPPSRRQTSATALRHARTPAGPARCRRWESGSARTCPARRARDRARVGRMPTRAVVRGRLPGRECQGRTAWCLLRLEGRRFCHERGGWT